MQLDRVEVPRNLPKDKPEPAPTSFDKANIYQKITALARVSGAVNLAQGIPEAMFDKQIDAAVASSLGLSWQYGPVQGDSALRDRVAAYHRRGSAGAENVIITSGCTEALFCALVSARHWYGDEVCYIEPYYSYYPGLIELAGMRQRTLRLDYNDGAYALDLGQVEAQLRSGAKILLLNAPHNPTGWTLNRPEAEYIVSLCRRLGGFIIFDSVYENFIYSEAGRGGVDILVQAEDICIVAGSVSKLLAASGLRLGWVIAPDHLVPAVLHAHMHSSNCQPLPLQAAITRLFDEFDGDALRQNNLHYRAKRDDLALLLTKLGFTYALPMGGHFIFAYYPPEKGASLDYVQRLIKTVKIAALPVESFYAYEPPSALRFSFAVSKQDLAQAASNVERLLDA